MSTDPPFIKLNSLEEIDSELDYDLIEWNAHDNRVRDYHGKVPSQKDFICCRLTWRPTQKTPLDQATPVGLFLLDMNGLYRQGFIRRENSQEYRLRFVHRALEILIEQSNAFGSGLRIARISF